MNLLGKNNQTDEKGKVRASILDILGEANLSEENMKIAVEFFDFDKEINLELLDKVTMQDFSCSGHLNMGVIQKLLNNPKQYDSEYLDRYILFADAAYGPETYCLFTSYYGAYYFTYRASHEDYDKIIVHALSRRFSEDESQSRFFAMFAEASGNNINEYLTSQRGIRAAKNLINAGRNCNSKKPDTEIKLYAAALKNIELEDIDSDEELAEGVKFALERIFTNLNVDYRNDRNFFNFMMVVGFIASKFSNPIELRMKQRVVGYEIKALANIISTLDGGYIDTNISRLDRIIDIGKKEKFTKECIKAAAACLFIDEKRGAADFLCNISVLYPKEFIEVMLSDDRISSMNNSYSWSTAICCFMPEMYRIISIQNEQALKEAGIVYKDAILDCTVRVLTKGAKIAKDMVSDYLFGKRNLKALEPCFDKLNDNFTLMRTDARLVDSCVEVNPEFKKKYYTFLAIARPEELGNIIVENTKFDDN